MGEIMVFHDFTDTIISQIKATLKVDGKELLQVSPLLEYINIKTKSANRGSKARGSFANLYAIYVLVEDYIKVVFDRKQDYKKYEGAIFSDLFTRQRELPFGEKLQNHALNHRLNEEFHKYFPTVEDTIIIRDIPTSRYWINTNLLNVKISGKVYDISKTIICIINEYIKAKKNAFEKFIYSCEQLQKLPSSDKEEVFSFISGLLEPSVDARLFEIVSFAILKYYYWDKKIFWGYDKINLQEENLKLYKTGRTNANDGGIDFVMKPLGNFYQVTETLDVKKYFLDIDKLEHYPVKFVIKTNESVEEILKHLRENAIQQYGIEIIVNRYMNSIDEVINIPMLILYLNEADQNGYLNNVLDEIILQSKVEFNYEEDNDE